MKKFYSIFILFFLFCFQLSGQWQTNGTAIYNSNSGNVGIGTSNPYGKLSILDNVNSTNGFLSFDYPGVNTWKMGVFNYNTSSLIIGNDLGGAYNNKILTLSNTGNIGINNSNPQSKLHIYDGNNNLRFGDFGASTAGIELTDGPINSTASVYLFGWGNSFRIGIGSPNESNHLFTLTNNGRIGLGITEPEANFHIKYTTNALTANLRLESSAAGQNASIQYVSGGIYRWEAGTGISSGTSYEIYDRLNNTSRVVIKENGNLGIGTTNPQNLLDVNGTIHAREVKVDLTGWSDFVFHPSYQLKPLTEVEKFIKANGHLHDIPSAAEVEQNGVNVGEMQKKLLQKVEELTLYVIELEKENKVKANQIKEQQKTLNFLILEIENLKTKL